MNDDTQRSVQLIEAAIQNLGVTLNEQHARLEEGLKSSSGDVHTKVAARKSLARNLALDRMLTEIWEEVQSYPTRRNRGDWFKHHLYEIDDPQGDKREQELDVSFLLNGHRYKFTYRDDGGTTAPDGDYFYHTRLSLCDATNNVLIEINISIEHDYVGSVFKPFDVSAFIADPWIQAFLECYDRLQANKKARAIKQKYDSEKVSELKNKFGLE